VIDMKGMVFWTIVIMFLTLVFLIFIAKNVFGMIGQTKQLGIYMVGEEIAGIINSLSSSYPNTEHIYSLPKTECSIDIKHSNGLTRILVSSGESSYSTETIETNTFVTDFRTKCDEKQQKPIYFKKCSNNIIISELPISC